MSAVGDRFACCGVTISDYGSHVVGPQKFIELAQPLAKKAIGKLKCLKFSLFLSLLTALLLMIYE